MSSFYRITKSKSKKSPFSSIKYRKQLSTTILEFSITILTPYNSCV